MAALVFGGGLVLPAEHVHYAPDGQHAPIVHRHFAGAASAVPESWRFVIAFNPIASFIEMTRGAVLFDVWPSAQRLLAMWALGIAVAWLGFYGFQRSRHGFADVL